MLNNGGLSGGSSCSSSGIGTPDNGSNNGMYGANGTSPSEYPPAPSSNPSSMSNPFHYPPHHPHHQQQQQQQHPHHRSHDQGPPMGNGGMMGHHSGGICSSMGLNQGACPPDVKTRLCGGCSEPIMDRVLFEAWDKYWHHSCLRCSVCGCQLADMGPSCFNREGMMLCRQDYLKLFGMKGACRGCGQHIPANEFVLRAGVPAMGGPPMVFHVNCFACSKCHKPLSTGDRYSVFNGSLLCEQDALKAMKQNGIGSPAANVAPTNGPTTAPRKGKVGRPRRSRD